MRMQRFRRLLEVRPSFGCMEAHNGLTGLIVERTSVDGPRAPRVRRDVAEQPYRLDGQGRPDIEAVDLTSRVQTVSEIVEVTTKPIVYRRRTGGKPEHFVFTVKTLERLGVSAVIIEDKLGLKKNSLFGTEAPRSRTRSIDFGHRSRAGRRLRSTDEFMIIARIESLILGKGMDDALDRAEAYIEAGADGIMIHSAKDARRDLRVRDRYTRCPSGSHWWSCRQRTTGSRRTELEAAGINVVIYANQLLRSAYPAMVQTAESILRTRPVA